MVNGISKGTKRGVQKKATVAIIGAGPLGLEMGAALTLAGIDFLQFEKGQIGQTVFDFPPETRFFSSSERIGIAGIPIHTTDQQKCSRELYLAYLRTVAEYYSLKINSCEEVAHIEKKGPYFVIKTKSAAKEGLYEARFLLFASGGLAFPRKLDIPGELLPHVSSKMGDPHQYFQKKVVIVGGKNSAAETALRSFHAGADVSLVIRKEGFDEKVIKYWLLPELKGRIKKGQIASYFKSRIEKIEKDRVILEGGKEIFCDFLIKAIGFKADTTLFCQLGIPLSSGTNSPLFDPETMESNLPGAYILGTVAGGTQDAFEVYIENTHQHVGKILAHLCLQLKIQEPSVGWIKKRFRTVTELEE